MKKLTLSILLLILNVYTSSCATPDYDKLPVTMYVGTCFKYADATTLYKVKQVYKHGGIYLSIYGDFYYYLKRNLTFSNVEEVDCEGFELIYNSYKEKETKND